MSCTYFEKQRHQQVLFWRVKNKMTLKLCLIIMAAIIVSLNIFHMWGHVSAAGITFRTKTYKQLGIIWVTLQHMLIHGGNRGCPTLETEVTLITFIWETLDLTISMRLITCSIHLRDRGPAHFRGPVNLRYCSLQNFTRWVANSPWLSYITGLGVGWEGCGRYRSRSLTITIFGINHLSKVFWAFTTQSHCKTSGW